MAQPFFRVRTPELMDDPTLDPHEHARALAGLRRVNAVTRADAILWAPLRKLAQKIHPRPIRILDVATGSGDLPIKLWHRFRNAGFHVEVSACDISPVALKEATRRAEKAKAKIDFFTCDVIAERIVGAYDAVISSLFMHHLDPPEMICVLKRMMTVASKAVFISDLRRSRGGWRAAYIGTRILSRSPIVHVDGPLSVAAAFTLEEVQHMAQEAGLHGATVEKRWPWRLLLSWHAPCL